MAKTVLIRGARQLLTMRGSPYARRGSMLNDLGMITDGAVLLKDGKVHSVGPSRRLENLIEARDAQIFDADGCVVMPGFVDPHTQPVSGPARVPDSGFLSTGRVSAASDPFRVALDAQVRSVRTLPARRLELQARNLLLRCLRHGTTAVEAKTGYGLDETGEMKSLRVLEDLQSCPLTVVPTWFGARALPLELTGNAQGYFEFLLNEMMPRVARRRTIPYVDIDPVSCGFTLQQSMQFLRQARTLQLTPRVHAALHVPDTNVELAVAFEAASVSHCNHISDLQIGQLCQSSTVAVLIPGASYHLRSIDYAPARRLIAGGAAVALASGYDPLLSPTCNMQMVISLACTQMNMTPAEALHATTFNAACAVGISSRAGSLEPGKSADALVLSVSDYREIPYHFGVNLVSAVFQKGELVHQETAPEWRVA